MTASVRGTVSKTCRAHFTVERQRETPAHSGKSLTVESKWLVLVELGVAGGVLAAVLISRS